MKPRFLRIWPVVGHPAAARKKAPEWWRPARWWPWSRVVLRRAVPRKACCAAGQACWWPKAQGTSVAVPVRAGVAAAVSHCRLNARIDLYGKAHPLGVALLRFEPLRGKWLAGAEPKQGDADCPSRKK